MTYLNPLKLRISDDNKILVSSLQVAEKFEKQHKHILELLRRKLYSVNSDRLSQHFFKSSYKDESGKSNLMYLMDRDGFLFLVMGFTGERADTWKLDFIDAFNAMEEALIEAEEVNSLEYRRGYITITSKNYHNLKTHKEKCKILIKQLNEKEKQIDDLEKNQPNGWEALRYSQLKIFHTSVVEATKANNTISYDEICQINKFMNDLI